MKFDFVIGNPPYQDSSHTEKKNTLWRKFLDLSINKLMEEGSHLAFVIPSSWMGSRKLLKKYFFPNNLKVINKDECKRHFNVGSTFSYFLLEKGKKQQKDTFIINKQINKEIISGTFCLNDIITDVFPRDISPETTSILKKVFSPKRKLLGIINNTTHHSVHRDRWRLKKEQKFKYPIQNTPSKLYWFNSKHKHQGMRKILIPTTTYFRRAMISVYGVTQSFCYWLIPDGVSEDVALKNINNVVFDYVNECYRYANWNSVPILRKLPEIPMKKKMTDEEVFKFFNLNKKEIKRIKETITW